MRKKPRNTGKSGTGGAYPLLGVAALLLIWQGACASGLLPVYALPTPAAVCRAFAGSFPLLMSHAAASLTEAFVGLFFGVALALLCAALMDAWPPAYKTLYPLLVVSQTVPAVAVAPLLVLWMGYGMAPKIVLIVIVCFFPVAVGVLDAFRALDPDVTGLLRAMGANRRQIFTHAKLPGALPAFFSGLKIAASYAVVGAVIAEWLGGDRGLGVYMTRVRKSYAFDKMFAVIFLISAVSLGLIWLVSLLERAAMPWKRFEQPLAQNKTETQEELT